MDREKEGAKSYTWEGETGRNFLEDLSTFVEQTCRRLGVDEKSCCHVQMAVGEAGANTKEHAYQGGKGKVQLEMKKTDSTLEIRLTDWGQPIQLDRVPEPKVTSNLEEARLDGLGVMIMRKAMDEVAFETSPTGNHLTMRKNLAPSTNGS
ncbi:MAG: ATP-binding protein [Anaerolineales bacterium]